MTGGSAISGRGRFADARALASIERRMEGELGAAEADLRTLVEAHPDDPRPLLLLARLCFRRSGFGEMKEAAEAALALAPDSQHALTSLAHSYYYLGELKAAAGSFGRLCELRPVRVNFERLGCCLMPQGRLDEAADAFQHALEAARKQDNRFRAVSHYQLGRILRDQGKGGPADRRMETLLVQMRRSPMAVSSTMLGVLNRLDFHEWDRFRKKEALCGAVAAYRRDKGDDAFPWHPRTYVMPEGHEAFRRDAAAGIGGPVWIVKPTALFGGQGMRLIDDPALVEPETGVIVQDYISDPYLLQGRKAHLRLYMLITAAAPLRAYFWHDGLVRFAPEPYRASAGWLDRQDMHITNTALHAGHPGLILSDNPEVEDHGHVWTLRAYVRHIGDAGGDVEALWRRLDELARGFLRVIDHSGLFARQAETPTPRAYPPKFIGMDVMLDSGLQPWLLESQRMPGQTGVPLVDATNGRLFSTIGEMMIFPLGNAPQSDWPTREAELEEANRGDFVPLSAPGGEAPLAAPEGGR